MLQKIDESSRRRSVPETPEESIRTVMLEKWNEIIFMNISEQLLVEALRLVKEERDGNIIDAQNVIGIRESFGKIQLFVPITRRIIFSGTERSSRGRSTFSLPTII